MNKPNEFKVFRDMQEDWYLNSKKEGSKEFEIWDDLKSKRRNKRRYSSSDKLSIIKK